MAYLIESEVELQVTVPTKSINQVGEHGLREVTIKQDTEFGFERHFKDKIDESKIDINFGFGKLTIKAEDLKEAMERQQIF